MQRTSRTMSLGLIVVLVGFFFVPKLPTSRAHAAAGCSAATVNGPYGVVGSGYIGAVPATFVGTFVYDGAGSSKADFVLNAGGAIDHIGDVTGTYTIDGGCNGAEVIHTIHHHPPVTHCHDMQIVVVDGGKSILFQVGAPKDSASGEAPPGEVLSGTMTRL